jgi:hypothetical protein
MRTQDEDFESGKDVVFFVDVGLMGEIVMGAIGLFFKNVEGVFGSSEVVVSG